MVIGRCIGETKGITHGLQEPTGDLRTCTKLTEACGKVVVEKNPPFKESWALPQVVRGFILSVAYLATGFHSRVIFMETA